MWNMFIAEASLQAPWIGLGFAAGIIFTGVLVGIHAFLF